MRFPESKTSLTTLGLTGNLILAGVIFKFLNPWWLVLAGFFIISAVGHEVGKR